MLQSRAMRVPLHLQMRPVAVGLLPQPLPMPVGLPLEMRPVSVRRVAR